MALSESYQLSSYGRSQPCNAAVATSAMLVALSISHFSDDGAYVEETKTYLRRSGGSAAAFNLTLGSWQNFVASFITLELLWFSQLTCAKRKDTQWQAPDPSFCIPSTIHNKSGNSLGDGGISRESGCCSSTLFSCGLLLTTLK
ncbi:uncharacterized protein MYCFIDRAFT_179654 [Pseudocercospora fijiensis CIRAD86]|uniref:Uncharacterized protein n=1 Tax=Pseudocercospora fijiensis (strain CIRAD86) TaxID=383855 RepID=M3ALB2_PSEFD|nr:uncharacterized protein MYCFIDRAFT_179654 [Pseudocercospora fijiensis CIRAD86]EME78222.1 hypothetical protein MYCFIDRAFT_179654 [Pseudocercospora fijiensis CIRAD86]